MNQVYQNILHELTLQKDTSAIKLFIENLSVNKKGDAFEWYLSELFKGNGWLTKVKGGRGDLGADILLYHPKTSSKVSLIVQAKNHTTPLTFDSTKIELIKFEDKASERHNCNQFQIVSVNGFVGEANKLQAFNMLLSSWDYVEKLIYGYDPDSKKEPAIDLYSHNKITYDKVKELWEDGKYVAVVQATGTGKSYIIARVMADFLEEEKLVMAPSKYILQQQESKVPWASQSTTFMTYAKGANLSSDEILHLESKLIVLDEFHRCGANIWGVGVQEILNTFPDAYVLGTSATPIRYLDNSRDMSDELFNNHVAENLSLAEAIVRRILPPPTYISAFYTLDEEADNLLTTLNNSRKSDKEKEQITSDIQKAKLDWERTSGIPKILQKHLTIGINKIVVFCKNEEHLDLMELEVQKWFLKSQIYKYRKAYRVLTADPLSDRNLERFKGDKDKNTIHLLFAIDMLNEGLHISDVGAVILLRPTESPIVFYQQIGRCLQIDVDHIPIIFDFVNNFKSIKANDFYINLKDASKRQCKKRKHLGLPEHSLNVEITDKTKNILRVFETISHQIQPWEVGLSYLKSYVKKFGTAKVPRYYLTDDGFNLGQWVVSRRHDYKIGVLTQDKKDALNAIPGWLWIAQSDNWERNFTLLKNYIEKYGNPLVPQGYVTPDGVRIGFVLGRIRSKYKQGKLPKQQIQALEAIPHWVWDTTDPNWEKGLEHLQEYEKIYENVDVPAKYISADGYNLGSWIAKRRFYYRKGTLPKDRVEILESFSEWKWEGYQPKDKLLKKGQRELSWERNFLLLKNYIEIHGNPYVPQDYVTPEGVKLGSWVNVTRTKYKQGKFSKKQLQALETIPELPWQRADVYWERNFTLLKNYIEKYGKPHVPQDYVTADGFKLGVWVTTIRSKYKQGKISKKQTQALEALQEWSWSRTEVHWETALEHLQEYEKIYKNVDVPAKYISADGYKLGAWLAKRRFYYWKGKLPKDGVDILESFSGWKWSLKKKGN